MYQKKVVFSTKIDTQSNANLEVTNSLLEKLRLTPLDDKFKEELNQLLRRRNIIAHGGEVTIKQTDIGKFVALVQDMAFDLKDHLINGFKDKVYLMK